MRRGLDEEHVIHAGGKSGGAAEDALLVGVVDDQDGDIGLQTEAAQVGENGLDGQDIVLVCAGHDVVETVDDDETSVEGVGALDEGNDDIVFGKVVEGGRDEMERGCARRVEAAYDEGEARPSALQSAFFVHDKYWSRLRGAAEPGLASGDADGEMEGEPGLFGAGRADEQVEAGTGDDALDEGGLGGRRGFESFPGGVDAQLADVVVGEFIGSLLDLKLHVGGVRPIGDGIEEGPLALGEGAGGEAADGVVGGLPFRRQGLRQLGGEAVVDKAGKDVSRLRRGAGAGNGVHGTPKAGLRKASGGECSRDWGRVWGIGVRCQGAANTRPYTTCC